MAKRLHPHPFFALGKQAAVKDPRTLQFEALVRPKVTLPAEYDYDLKHPRVPLPMFGNDVHGNCVIAARAHNTLRLEQIEQKTLVKISDQDVIDQYYSESGGKDSGLVMIYSMKNWVDVGWKAGVKKRRYFVKGFAELNPHNHQAIKEAIFMDAGVHLGLSLPLTAAYQMDAGKPWNVVAAKPSQTKPNSWGGHAVYVSGYTVNGPVCVTWGRKQAMSWEFVDVYCDEAYVAFDAVNAKQKKMLKQIQAYMKALGTRHHW